MSCKFHVLQFHALHFHALQFGPPFSCPAILMVRHFHFRHCQRPHIYNTDYYKFSSDSNSEISLNIGQYLMKLTRTKKCAIFLRHHVYYTPYRSLARPG